MMTVKGLVVVVLFLSGFGWSKSQLTWDQFVDLIEKLPVSGNLYTKNSTYNWFTNDIVCRPIRICAKELFKRL